MGLQNYTIINISITKLVQFPDAKKGRKTIFIKIAVKKIDWDFENSILLSGEVSWTFTKKFKKL